jgi:PAS domain S-box-containing protein
MTSVLYVDDEPSLTELAGLYLKKSFNLQVDTALSITDALRLLQNRTYDAIVSDFFLPDGDGLALLRSLRSGGNETPFILFTGRGREEVAIEALNTGVSFYLQKGGDPRAQFTELSHMIAQTVARRSVEQALRESEELFRTVVNTMLDVILILDWNGKILFANRAAFQLVGMDPHVPVTSLHIARFVTPESWSWVMKDLAMVKAGEGGFLREYPIITVQGEEKWVEGLGTPILYQGEEVNLVCLRDVTRKKRAELALCTREELFREVFHNANDAIVLNELTEDGRPGRFIEVNNLACSRLLYSREELLSLTPADLGLKVSSESSDALFRQLHQMKPVMFEGTLRSKSGTVIPFEINAHICSLNGSRMILSVARDITERKINEAVEKKAFDQIEKNIDQLAILGDHVRNPLAVIIGLADLTGSESGKKIVEQARIIDQLITRLDMQWIESEKVREFIRRNYREEKNESSSLPEEPAERGDLPISS